VQIISDNPKYKVMEAMIDQVHINGKVIWFGRDVERR
jgi:phage repressor protein C with HTH and peptisase S24 domain